MMEEPNITEQKIKEAARAVFHREGFEGARMQAIADEAKINKAMLHYYYRNKKKLFDEVFEEDYFTTLMPLGKILRDPAIPVEEQIRLFTTQYIDTMMANPRMPLFLLHELARNPERFLEITKKAIPVSKKEEPDHPKLSATTFMDQIREGIRRGIYNPINPEHFAVSFLGMCTYPVVSRVTIKHAYMMDDDAYDAFLNERKEEVVDQAFRILMKPDYYKKRMKKEF